MSITKIREVITAEGGTPTQFTQGYLVRELLSTLGATPTQFGLIPSLRELVTEAGGTPTQWSEVGLLRETVTALGGAPAYHTPDELWGQILDLGFIVDPSAGYALYLPFSATSPTYRSGATTSAAPPEKILDPGFDNLGFWGADAPITISGGKANFVNAGNSALYTPNFLNVGAQYVVTYTIDSITGDTFSSNNGGTIRTAPGTYTETITANTTFLGFNQRGSVAATVVIDNVSCKAVVGSIAAMPGYTYTRSGPKGEVNALSGADRIDDFAANVPGIVPGVGYWSRGAVTNLVKHSQDIGGTGWSNNNVLQTANAATAPDGTTTADLLYPLATASDVRPFQDLGALSAQAYTVSYFFKAAGMNWVQITDETTSGARVWFDLGTGVVGTQGAGLTGYIKDCGNGWYRCIVVFTSAGGGATRYVAFGPCDGDNTNLCTKSGTNGVYAWQAQLLAGNFPDGGPIITTAGTTVAIGADVLTETQAAPTDQDQIIFVRANLPAYNGVQGLLYMSDAGFNNTLLFRVAGAAQPQVVVTAATATVRNSQFTTPTAGTDFTLICQRVGANWRLGIYTGGSLTWDAAASAGAFPAGMVNIYEGHDNGGNAANGLIKAVGHKIGTFANDAAIIAALA